MGVGLASLRPTPTFIVPVLPSRGDVLSLPQADRRFGFHREPDARHFAPRPPGHSAHQVDFVTQPRRSSGLVMAETTETPSLPSTPSLRRLACLACSFTSMHSALGRLLQASPLSALVPAVGSIDVCSCRPWCARPDSRGSNSQHGQPPQTSMPVARRMLSRPSGRHLHKSVVSVR